MLFSFVELKSEGLVVPISDAEESGRLVLALVLVLAVSSVPIGDLVVVVDEVVVMELVAVEAVVEDLGVGLLELAVSET